MRNILALLQCLQSIISETDVRRMSREVQAMLSMTGRVTILGLSRWGGKGCSYRTVQRFFSTIIPWPGISRKFFERHIYQSEREYILVGYESTITKSGKKTYGLDYFFSVSLSLVSVAEQQSYPLQIEQIIRTEAENAAAKEAKEKKAKRDSNAPKKNVDDQKAARTGTKQYWGLEDWMNVKEVPLTNALNLSLFMVNPSHVLLREFRQTHPESGVIDLKAYFRAAKYFEETIRLLPKKPEPILLDQIFGHIASLGCIHPINVLLSPP